MKVKMLRVYGRNKRISPIGLCLASELTNTVMHFVYTYIAWICEFYRAPTHSIAYPSRSLWVLLVIRLYYLTYCALFLLLFEHTWKYIHRRTQYIYPYEFMIFILFVPFCPKIVSAVLWLHLTRNLNGHYKYILPSSSSFLSSLANMFY